MQLQSHVGKTKGSFRNKDNRTAKLLSYWDTVKSMMERYVIAGHGVTLRARTAYGVLLMMETGIRIGNETSAEGYICDQKYHTDYGKKVQTFGLTTLRKEHTIVSVGGSLILQFLGKKAVHQHLRTSNAVLVKYYGAISSQSRSLGYSTWLGINYGDIYKFIKKSIGKKFKPKDIRTAAVNLLFLRKVEKSGIMKKRWERKKDINQAVKLAVDATAAEIGHTPGVCKSAYLSRALQSVIKERLYESLQRRKQSSRRG